MVPLPATSNHTKVADANRQLYASLAPVYDASEGCVVDERLKERLREGLSFALSHLPVDSDLAVLDACGGSGNASLILLAMGMTPLTVDISPEMLSVFLSKASASGFEPNTVVGDIDSFLAQSRDEWDLIVFSSALHHLDDYRRVLTQAMERVKPSGVILTMFDPTCVGSVGQTLRRLDYLSHFAISDLRGFVHRMYDRTRALSHSDVDIGVLAERHAMTGVDDGALLTLASERGWATLRHSRFYEARLRASRLVLRLSHMPSSFSLVIQAPAW